MPSPRTSPALRPTSPLSPQPARFEMLQPPSPRSAHTRQGNTTRRVDMSQMKLNKLPRFHPLNFSGGSPENGPLSPRAHMRVVSDAQKQLHIFHRESVAAATRGQSPSRPTSPRLAPLGSPGPVTPLELEGEKGGYFGAGVQTSSQATQPRNETIERIAQSETRRKDAQGSATAGAHMEDGR